MYFWKEKKISHLLLSLLSYESYAEVQNVTKKYLEDSLFFQRVWNNNLQHNEKSMLWKFIPYT